MIDTLVFVIRRGKISELRLLPLVTLSTADATLVGVIAIWKPRLRSPGYTVPPIAADAYRFGVETSSRQLAHCVSGYLLPQLTGLQRRSVLTTVQDNCRRCRR